jgi:2'-5' RNA ligase
LPVSIARSIMTALFIAAVPSDKVLKRLAEVQSYAENADAWEWKHTRGPQMRGLAVTVRYLGNVSEEEAKKALHKLHVLAPVPGVKVTTDWTIFADKVCVGIWGLQSFADVVYDLTRHIGPQSGQKFGSRIVVASRKKANAKISFKHPPEQKFNVEELVLLRVRSGEWGVYDVVDKVKLRQYCHRCGYKCLC